MMLEAGAKDPRCGSGGAPALAHLDAAREHAALTKAVIEVLLTLRAHTATAWFAVPSLRANIATRCQSIMLQTLYESAAAMGVLLDYREDWEAFAALVAERLPNREGTGE